MKKFALTSPPRRTITWCLVALCLLAESSVAQDHAYTVRGLDEPAEIVVDEWGVPHIYAATHYDAFFVQGFNAARDRLWQIDLWRRRGLGQLSEVLGEAYLQQDQAARLFLYRGDMYREWLAYASDAKLIAEYAQHSECDHGTSENGLLSRKFFNKIKRFIQL